MSINQLTTSNTFGDWLSTTNELVVVANSVLIGTINNNITQAYNTANSAYDLANTTNVRSQSAYDLANTINIKLQSAYDLSNSNYDHAQDSYNQSNTANTLIYSLNDSVDGLLVFSQAAYNQSNAASSLAVSVYAQSNSNYDHANTISIRTESAYTLTNSTSVIVQSAYDFANSINSAAYTDVTNITLLAPGTYGNSTLIPVLTVESNGRISAIANAPITIAEIENDTTSTTENYLLFTETTGTLSNLKISTSTLSFKPSTNTLTLPNVSVTGSITENVYSTTSASININNGTIQILTISANVSITHNLSSGQSLKLQIVNPSAKTITWPTITWQDGVEPVLSSTKYTTVELWKVNTIVYGTKWGDY